MPSAVVRNDDAVGAGLDAELDILAGHDALGDNGKIRRRFDPCQIFPRRRGVGTLPASPGGPRRICSCFRIIDTAVSLIVVADVALALGWPLRVQSNYNRLIVVCFRAF